MLRCRCWVAMCLLLTSFAKAEEFPSDGGAVASDISDSPRVIRLRQAPISPFGDSIEFSTEVGTGIIIVEADGEVALGQSADARVRIQQQRQALIQSLQQLQDEYCRAAMLDEAVAVRDQIRRLQADAQVALPELPVKVTNSGASLPETNLSPRAYRGRHQEIHFQEVTGSTSGSVWGSGPYTDDSSLAAAAVHSGHLAVGEKRVVAFRVLPDAGTYQGSTAHDITTMDYAGYLGAFEILGAAIREEDFSATGQPKGTETVDVFVTGRTSGFVWGSSVYTNDSDLGTAAVHAGLLKPGESAIIQVELLSGRESYDSTTQNGISTRPYGSWSGSIVLRRRSE
ncbi:MAG: LCCL domain-containing protein [Planctomycetaceae bacterium]